jgi:hypothetical protein
VRAIERSRRANARPRSQVRRPAVVGTAVYAAASSLLALVPAAAGAQGPSGPRPPAIERSPAYELSVGVAAHRWEADRVDEAVGPVLRLRRSVYGAFFAGVRVGSVSGDLATSASSVQSRFYFATAEVGFGRSFALTPAFELQPSVHAAIGTAVTAPRPPELTNRSQNAWGAGGALFIVYESRWIASIEYQRLTVNLEDPAAPGAAEARATHTDTLSLLLGMRF